VRGDIQSIDLLSFVLESEQIDTVMHFAAQVRPSSPDLLRRLDQHPPSALPACWRRHAAAVAQGDAG
jgi:hypothetical protein